MTIRLVTKSLSKWPLVTNQFFSIKIHSTKQQEASLKVYKSWELALLKVYKASLQYPM